MKVYYDPINKNVVPKERVYNAHNRVPTQRAVNPHNRGNIEPHKFSDHEELFTNERHETFMLRQFDTGNPRQPIPASSIPQPPRRMDAYTLHPDHQFGRKRHEMLNPFGPQRGVRDQNTGALLGVISHPPASPAAGKRPEEKKGETPKAGSG
ncbi:hypothetical protein N7470_006636 [Penicillium chermesinum]|nr:hypothetical protein N7470_006636 [Penicillium chermesinum]